MSKSRFKASHLLLALVPLAFTPGLVFLLAEGILSFGGGEKDLILALPYIVWALLFFITALVLIIKQWSIARWFQRSLLVSIGLMLSLWIVVWLTGSLGVA